MRFAKVICLSVFVSAGALAAQTPASEPASGTPRRPNVVILFPDQLRWAEVGCYGHPVVRSPNIDRLAAGGVRMGFAFTNFPVCSPARSVLLSGRYARSTGVLQNQDQEAKPGRPTNQTTTLPEVLAANGYDTALVGKWHLAPTPETLGFQQSLRPRMRHRYFKQTFYRNEGEPYVFDDYGPFHETDAAIQFIREKRDRPFFLYLAYGPPHMPVSEMPEKYGKMYDPARVIIRDNAWVGGKLAYDENWFKIYMWDFQYYENKDTFARSLPAGMTLRELTALYDGQITAVDDCIGRVLGAIRDAGIEDDTIVLLTSDHGDLLGSHGLFNKNTHHEEAAHIPMIFRYPRRLKPSVVDTQVVSLVDAMPTLLDLCGIRTPDAVQGTSVASVLLGQKPAVGENAAFIETGNAEGIRTLRHMYFVERKKGGGEHLFDVPADPYEMKDLAGDPASRETLKNLRARVQEWTSRNPRWLEGKPRS
jgi:arylsulfatase A-like enzyme